MFLHEILNMFKCHIRVFYLLRPSEKLIYHMSYVFISLSIFFFFFKYTCTIFSLCYTIYEMTRQ